MMFMAKAIVAAVIAGLGTLVTALTDETVTASEWATIALATVVALGAVFGIPNRSGAIAGRHAPKSPGQV